MNEKYTYTYICLRFVMIKIYFRNAREFEEISCPREIQTVDCKLHKRWLLKYTRTGWGRRFLTSQRFDSSFFILVSFKVKYLNIDENIPLASRVVLIITFELFIRQKRFPTQKQRRSLSQGFKNSRPNKKLEIGSQRQEGKSGRGEKRLKLEIFRF